METTMAETPKARNASSGPLAFPVPAPPDTARMMPVFAFPPSNGQHGPTRRTTVRVPRRSGSLSDSLAGLASFVENAPMPTLPESVWSALGRAWFFIAGATMGILLALALIAVSGPSAAKRTPSREGRVGTAQGTARVLVVQRVPTAMERGIGPLAENDLDEVTPVSAPPLVARRTAVVARHPLGATAPHRPATGGKDLLNAGL